MNDPLCENQIAVSVNSNIRKVWSNNFDHQLTYCKKIPFPKKGFTFNEFHTLYIFFNGRLESSLLKRWCYGFTKTSMKCMLLRAAIIYIMEPQPVCTVGLNTNKCLKMEPCLFVWLVWTPSTRKGFKKSFWGCSSMSLVFLGNGHATNR